PAPRGAPVSTVRERPVRVLSITNQGNFDPDGFISRYILEHPVTALQHRDFLIAVARFTDYEFFGGRRYPPDYGGADEPAHVKIAWEMLEMINEQKARFAETVTGRPIDQLSREE